MSLTPVSNSTSTPCWPNKETLISSTKIAINLACYLTNSSLITTAALNFSLRCFSIYQTPNSRKYYRVPMDIAASFVVLFPHGILVSLGIDTLSEAINFYKGRAKNGPQSPPNLLSSKRLDPQNFENACKILGLQPGEEQDRSKVESQYKKILSGLEERKSKASGPIANGLQELIDDAQKAYSTLTRAIDLLDAEQK